MLAFQPNFPTRLRDNFAARPAGSCSPLRTDRRSFRLLIALVGQDRRVRDRVDDARAEERRCVALANVDFGDSDSSDGLDAGGRIGGLG